MRQRLRECQARLACSPRCAKISSRGRSRHGKQDMDSGDGAILESIRRKTFVNRCGSGVRVTQSEGRPVKGTVNRNFQGFYEATQGLV